MILATSFVMEDECFLPEHMELAEWLVFWAPKLASRFDVQLGHLYDACTSLPQKSQAAIKWLEIRKKKKKKGG